MDHEEFESLDAEEQARIFFESPIKEKGDLLRHSHRPSELTRSLSEEELYLITRELDPAERSEIIKYANLPQLFYVGDMDCWNRDTVSLEGFLGWLDTLYEADPVRLLAWMRSVDHEVLVAGFQKCVSVLKPDWEYAIDEALGDKPYFSIDRLYYILAEEDRFQTIKQSIEVLYEGDRKRYVSLLESIMNEMDYEVEEGAYGNRERRLADRGFPDLETARRIYVPMTKAEFTETPLKKRDMRTHAFEQGPLRSYPLIVREEESFLDRTLRTLAVIPEGEREGIYEEMIWISNKLVAVEGIGFMSEDRLRMGVERMRWGLSLGLELLSGGDFDEAHRLMRDRWLEYIFRYTVDCLRMLRRETETHLLSHWRGEAAHLDAFLDYPYGSIVRGTLRAFPQFHDPVCTEDARGLRDFRSADEYRRALTALKQVEEIHRVLAVNSPALFQRLGLDYEQGNHESTLFSVLGTVFCNYGTGRGFSPEPVTAARLKQLVRNGFEDRGGKRMMIRDLCEGFLDGFHGQEKDAMRPVWGLIFERVEAQLGTLNADEGIDTRFLTCVCISRRSGSVRASAPGSGKSRGEK